MILRRQIYDQNARSSAPSFVVGWANEQLLPQQSGLLHPERLVWYGPEMAVLTCPEIAIYFFGALGSIQGPVVRR